MSWRYLTEQQAADRLHLPLEALRRGVKENKIKGPYGGEQWTTDHVHQLIGDKYFFPIRKQVLKEYEAEQLQKSQTKQQRDDAEALKLGRIELARRREQEKKAKAEQAAALIGGDSEDYLTEGEE